MIYGSGAVLVVDTSAWARQHHPKIAEHYRTTAEADLLATCPLVALELLAVARGLAAYDPLDEALRAMRTAPITAGVCTAALGASRELSSANHPRVPVADYLIAAAAAERGFGVLHYDRHYDTLATVLGFQSVWIAPAGEI